MTDRRSVVSGGADPVEIGSLPPVGEVPARMHAQVVRPARYGEPASAFAPEVVDTPAIGPDEVLVAVMAAGINYNNVWAARGYPVDQVALRQKQGETEDFHIGGSDLSGIVYAVGDAVDDVAVGDNVVVHHGYWLPDDPWVQAHQILPEAEHLTWEEAAAPSLVGTTAYRMLFGWAPNTVQSGDVVLVWGGSGGLGSQAIQLAAHAGATPVAVVSDDERGQYAQKLGAAGWINRRDYDHWGIPPRVDDTAGQKAWGASARAFGKKLSEVLGERRDPAIVFEHPGQDTIPTSIYLCATGGMVVICAGTTGFDAVVDLRYHWTRQKRFQGSHGTNDEQARLYNDLVRQEAIDPCLGKLRPFSEIPDAHEAMARGEEVFGNAVCLVGAAEPGQGRQQ
jgi:crotonyl-CoA carboxylase/reductase